MNAVIAVWAFFQNNILTKPAFFVGLIVFIGYLLLKKPIYEALAGFIKATVGYMILNVAAGGLVVNFRPILAGLSQRFHLTAAVIDPYFGQVAAQKAVEEVGRSDASPSRCLYLESFVGHCAKTHQSAHGLYYRTHHGAAVVNGALARPVLLSALK